MLQHPDILGIIPARMASTRFPGKPAALIGGIPMVIRVYRAVSPVLPNLVIASGDDEISQIAARYGAGFIRTTEEHLSGTSRCNEAAANFPGLAEKRISAVINIQGDEPTVSAEAINLLAADIRNAKTGISTLVRRETDPDAYLNPNRVKVVTDRDGNALYFSRSPLPHYRDGGYSCLSHIGLYAFKTEILSEISRLEPSPLEMDRARLAQQ